MQPDLIAPRETLTYHDARSIDLPVPMTALEAWNLAMREPLPGIRLAFKIRDAISSLFGVKPIGGFSGRKAGIPKVGDRIDFSSSSASNRKS